MSDIEESVSQWIAGLKAGDVTAAGKLWQRYYRRLVGLARKKLGSSPRRVADEDDVVADAFASFWNAAQRGRFPELNDRNDLWHLIVRITERKAYDQVRDLGRRKRGGGKVLGESAFARAGGASSVSDFGIDAVGGLEPTPEFAALAADAVGELLAQLEPEIREIALMKLEGYSNEEIAARIVRSLATVERRLKMIRAQWSKSGARIP